MKTGRIDLAILFLTSQHLSPHDSERNFRNLFGGMGSVATAEDLRVAQSFLSVERGRRSPQPPGPVQVWTSQPGAKSRDGLATLQHAKDPRHQGPGLG